MFDVDCRPEDVGLDSAVLQQAFDAFRAGEIDGTVPGGVMTVARNGKVRYVKLNNK